MEQSSGWCSQYEQFPALQLYSTFSNQISRLVEIELTDSEQSEFKREDGFIFVGSLNVLKIL